MKNTFYLSFAKRGHVGQFYPSKYQFLGFPLTLYGIDFQFKVGVSLRFLHFYSCFLNFFFIRESGSKCQG